MKAIRHVFNFAIIIIGCLLLSVINPVLADSALPEGKIVKKTFQSPVYKGKRLDWCRSWAKDCGKGAADAWCKEQGYEEAAQFQIDKNIGKTNPTKIISSGQICDQGFCDGFKSIECLKHWCPVGPKDKCCYGKEC